MWLLLVGLLACTIVEDWSTGSLNWVGQGDCTLEDLVAWGKGRGSPVEGFHCPLPGPDPSGCYEWDEGTIDIGVGSRGYVRNAPPRAPDRLGVN